MDKRKNNGGAGRGQGNKAKLSGEKKVSVRVGIKKKHVESAKKELKKIADKINKK